MEFLQDLFTSDRYMPHGHCYNWEPGLVWLNVISDGLIAFSYYSIPLALVYFVRKRTDLVFDWMFLCFAAFIVLCGTTHVMEVWNVWEPLYWIAGLIKAATALTSIVTAILLVRLIPTALKLPSPAALRRANEALQHEVQERKAAAARAEELNAELRQQTVRLEAINQELESFGYSVSHDLRAPLRHIDGYVDMLREDAPNLGEDGKRYVTVISESAKRMGLLIDNLLDFSRMGRAALNPEPVETTQIVEQVRKELEPDMKGRSIQWHIAALPKVTVDKALFRQVWLNLMGNAIKYTQNREKADITIGCEEREDAHEFFIRDNGAGFDMRYADKLFGIFQRLHFKEEFDGVGIGLANVRRIIQRHGGQTWADGKPDAGATFFFTLPKVNGFTTDHALAQTHPSG